MENQEQAFGMEQGAMEQPAPQIDQYKLDRYLQEVKDNQTLLFGILGGLAAGLAGAAVWALITAWTNYQIGWMAVGVGFLVGLAVRYLGRGIDTAFGIAGGAIALVSCVAGNLLAVVVSVSNQESIPFFQLLSRINPQIAIDIMKETFHPMDVLFYGLAVYVGYKYSFKAISDEELAKLTS